MTKNEFLSTAFVIIGLLFLAGCGFIFYGAAYFGKEVSDYFFNYYRVVIISMLCVIAGRLMARENRAGWIIGMSIAIEGVIETIISSVSHLEDENPAMAVTIGVVILFIYLILIIVLLARDLRIRYRVNLFVWGVVIAFVTALLLL